MSTPQLRVLYDEDGDGFIPRRVPVGTLVSTMPYDVGGYAECAFNTKRTPLVGSPTYSSTYWYVPVSIKSAIDMQKQRQELPSIFTDSGECSPTVRSVMPDISKVTYSWNDATGTNSAYAELTRNAVPSSQVSLTSGTPKGIKNVLFGERGIDLASTVYTMGVGFDSAYPNRTTWTLPYTTFDSAKRYKIIARLAIKQMDGGWTDYLTPSNFSTSANYGYANVSFLITSLNSSGVEVGTVDTLTNVTALNSQICRGDGLIVWDAVGYDTQGSTLFRGNGGATANVVFSVKVSFSNVSNSYTETYDWVGTSEIMLLGAWIVEAPEMLSGGTSTVTTSTRIDGDISEWVTSAQWALGGGGKTDLVSSDTDAVFNIHNDGRFTDGTITLPVGNRIVVETPVNVRLHDDTYYKFWQRMWTGYVEQTVPIVGNVSNQQGEIRASVGIFRAMDGLEINLDDQEFPIEIRPQDVTLASIPDIRAPDYVTDGSTYITVDEWAAIFTPKTYTTATVLAKVLEKGSWKSAGTLTGFRLNEALLGTSTVLVNMADMTDLREATKELPFVGRSYVFKERTVGDMVETLAKTEWAHVLTDRLGGLKLRKVSYTPTDTLPTLYDKNAQAMRYSINPDESYNSVQVEYTPIEIVPADIIRTRETDTDDSADDLDELRLNWGIKRSVPAGGAIRWVRDVKGLAVWRADNGRTDWGFDGFYGRDKFQPTNIQSSIEFIPYDVDKQTLLSILDGNWEYLSGGENIYLRAASVVYSSPAGAGTWTLSNGFELPDLSYDRTPNVRGRVEQTRKKDGKFMVLVYNTTGSSKDYWIKRLTGLWCIERDKETAFSEFYDPTAQIETVKSYTLLNTAVTNEDDAVALADEVVEDLLPRKEYTEYEFVVRDDATLEMVQTLGIGDRVSVSSRRVTPIEAANCHLITGEKHNFIDGHWQVVYTLRRVKDV